MQRILLFDWNNGGHHARYLRHFALAVSPFARVKIAAPDKVLNELSDLPVDTHPLESERPAVNVNEPLAPQNARLALEELDLMERVTTQARPDHVVNLYGDPIIRRFVQRKRPFPAPVSLCMFFVRDHYPARFRTRFSVKEQLRAQFLRWNLTRFRSRADAHTLFFLDNEAVDVYRRRGGVPVRWFPEPPVAPLEADLPPQRQGGFAIYGSLAPRKGIEWVSKAICDCARETQLTLAGSVDPMFAEELDRQVNLMRAAGAQIDLRSQKHNEQAGLRVLAESAATILAYPAHYGMSRVLLESCSVGTPVIAHDFGLLGHLVRQHGLGLVVDCSNARALGDALLRMKEDAGCSDRLSKNLQLFTNLYRTSNFRNAVTAAFQSHMEVRQLAESA